MGNSRDRGPARRGTLTTPEAQFIRVLLNTSLINDKEAHKTLTDTERILKLPCVDPIRTGVDPIRGLKTWSGRGFKPTVCQSFTRSSRPRTGRKFSKSG
ncbi:DUF1611 domain-containing protein [Mesorhizobium sp. YC-39]|uniref:DUF1611 domain-containing protein n=1 Tax=unclassified Mesorhizobium TaxID=325217 RepID=UPI0039963159